MNDLEIILRYFPSLTSLQKERLEALKPLYSEWNSKINVISRNDIENLYLHHVLHSLSIAMFWEKYAKKPKANVMDLGTGGGFPGIPLAILFPEYSFILVDSIGKKIKVADRIIASLGLENATAINKRAEMLNIRDEIGCNKFDWIVSRAVTSLSKFYPWVRGKYSDGILYLKGGDITDELAEFHKINKIAREDVTIFNLQEWIKEEYFAEKKLLYIAI